MSTADSAAGAAPTSPRSRLPTWARSRTFEKLAHQLYIGSAMFLVWIALFLLSMSVTGAIANSFPGVEPLRSMKTHARDAASVVGFVGLLLILVLWSWPLHTRRRFPRTLKRTWLLIRGFLRNVLGLIFTSRRQAAAALVAGLAAGLISVGVGYALRSIPSLYATIPETDPRHEALSDSPAWVPPAFFATVSPVWEEVFYRGPLLALAAIVIMTTKRATVRALIIGAAVLVISVGFGVVHVPYSLANGISAGVTGAIFGVVALTTRSLWAAIIAHAVFNALVMILPT